MRTLKVSIEYNGAQRPVGTISGDDPADAEFCYDRDYLDSGKPISVSLPLTEAPFSPSKTRSFFEGLLPEGFTRRSVAQWIRADEQDYLSILAALGKECLGALQIEDADSTDMGASYKMLSMDEVRKLAAEGATRSAEIVVSSHLSLTGASGKVGLYFDKKNGSWHQPLGTAPSTHIVKQSHVRLQNIIENEELALRTAMRLGIPTVESTVINTGAFAEDEILLAAKRYDRDLENSMHRIDGLPAPLRLHQEDFAQALGIPSSAKYERRGDNYLQKMFRLIRNESSDPIRDQIRLLDLLIYDFLIGNTDNHIKNISLLYDPDLKSISLAPSYDILSTVVYREGTAEMSVAVAGETDWRRISRETFINASADMGISPRIIRREYDRLSSGFADALYDSAQELMAQGLRHCGELAEKIAALRAGAE